MASQQLHVRISAALARRLRQQVPVRGRNAFVQGLLEHALAPERVEHDQLARLARQVERDERLNAEIMEWDCTVSDGLGSEATTAERA